MAGIYGLLSRNTLFLEDKVYNYFYSSSLEGTIKEEKKYKNFIYGRSVINKFLNDRVLMEDDELIISFEGIYFNKDEANSFTTLKTLYLQDGIASIKKIEGQFCGFIYDKKLDKLFIFNDHLNTRPLYIYKSEEFFIFASELKVVTKLQTELGIKKELNNDALYSMLTFGYMLNNITYEKNTKKLDYATICEVDNNLISSEKKYFQFKKDENYSLSKDEIIEKVDKLLLKSVQNCWKKDDEYNYKHYSFLSGGLDSRVNLFLAKELGYENVLALTFSQSGSSDESIAQEISSKEGFEHLFYSLDNGKYLEYDLSKFILANDGLNNLLGAASAFHFLLSVDHTKFGALHSGQIGDLLFGSYVKSNFDIKQGLMTNQHSLIKKITFIEEYIDKYSNTPEIFGYEQRVINGTFNGDRTLANVVDQLSPFYNRELIEVCLNIPDIYKKDEAIYLDWFNKKHPSISDYIWESAGVNPKNISYVKVAKKFKRYKNGILRRLGYNINDMNPFDIWLRTNKKILNNLDAIYEQKIEKIDDNALKNILKNMYTTDIKYSHYGRNNKFVVVSLLLALELHFGNEVCE